MPQTVSMPAPASPEDRKPTAALAEAELVPTKSLAERLSLRMVLTALFIAIAGMLGVLLLRVSYTLLRDNKTRDVWAIYFLEMEGQAKLIADDLIPHRSPELGRPTAGGEQAAPGFGLIAPRVLAVEDNLKLRLLSGRDDGLKTLADLGIKRRGELADWNLIWVHGRAFAALRARSVADNGDVKLRLILAPFARKVKFKADAVALSQSLVYIGTKQGKLVYANAAQVTDETFEARPLVQKFIQLPIPQGQVELAGEGGRPFYGFFMEIPNTNLVIFAETAKDVVTRDVARTTRRLVMVTLVILLGASAIMFLFLNLILRPIGKIAHVALTVAKGNFNVLVEATSFGEIRYLSEAFSTMIRGLKERDRVIQELMREQETQIRLQSELEIAKKIQENLLSTIAIPEAAGVAIEALYLPASEVAGDWYGFFYDPGTGATVITVVDISGHGVGSSMFTAITAAIFEEFRVGFAAAQQPLTFFDRLSAQLKRYGNDIWYATATMAIYWAKEGKVDVITAGHPRPLASNREGFFKVMPLKLSRPLGMEGPLLVDQISAPLGKGQLLLLYSDGLIEWRSPTRRALGSTGLARALNKALEGAPASLIKQALAAAHDRADGTAQPDDICIVAVRAL